MRAIALTLLTTALCGTAVLAAKPPVATLPAGFHGEWTTEPDQCHADMPTCRPTPAGPFRPRP